MTNINPEVNATVAVIGKRYNPQLGTYITGPYVGRIARVNKNSFSVKFDKASDNEYYPKSFNFYGNARKGTDCLYGSMSYEAHTIQETIDILESSLSRYPADSFKADEIHKTIQNLRSFLPVNFPIDK